ncbi:hypothetical protein DEM27_02235 [Metarhizobium album]|uniref:Uncharacterized protein n=1 Tax=Metarhizobium album TaxID=2182425 RepID=A0A2U2DXI9_9HYPH|nr:hypothetical protein [Rhizobium album]PWE58030.1 hypothetical protein DEM27_02235 [Rhizobium album]
MLTKILLAGGLLAATAFSAAADDTPQYDRQLEAAMIARLQTRLPELRSSYDVTGAAQTAAQKDEATDWAELLKPSIMKYRGRIIWL